MLNAMMHTIITEGLTDQQYIAGYTEGYDELKRAIAKQSISPLAARWIASSLCSLAQTLRVCRRQ